MGHASSISFSQSRSARSRNLELSVREERADHELVLWTFCRLVVGSRAECVGSTAGERLRHQLTIRCDDVNLNALHRNGIAGLENGSLRCAGREVDVSPPLNGGFDEVATIEAAADRHEFREFLKATGVIRMEVTEHEVIDLRQPSLLDDVCDPLAVAPVHFPARVVEERFSQETQPALRRPLDVDPVDIERASLSGR